MKIKNIKNVSGKIAHFFRDDLYLYLLIPQKNLIEILVVDPDDLSIVANFMAQYQPNLFVQPTIDNDSIYLPSIDGRVLRIDKFTGKLLTDIDLGMMMPTNMSYVVGDMIFTPCGIPIVHNLKTNIKNYAICANDKESGKKVFQSSSISGKPSDISVSDSIWTVSDKFIYQFSLSTELRSKSLLNFKTNFTPIIFEDQICVASPLGSLEFFNNSLQNVGRMLIPKMVQNPFVREGKLICVCEKEIAIINPKEMSKKHEFYTNQLVRSYCHDNSQICMLSDKLVVLFNLDTRENLSLGLDKILNDKAIIMNNNIFATSNNEIIQICQT